MTPAVWDELTPVEHDFMVCAMEAWGILPYACEARDDSGAWISYEVQVAVVLSLVDRGWVDVCRIEPWTDADGRSGATYGPPIDRAALPALLADPDTWDDPKESWIGELTLQETEAWLQKLTEGRDTADSISAG